MCVVYGYIVFTYNLGYESMAIWIDWYKICEKSIIFRNECAYVRRNIFLFYWVLTLRKIILPEIVRKVF